MVRKSVCVCDRCGREVDDTFMHEIRSHRLFFETHGVFRSLNGSNGISQTRDLCPSCFDEFRDFMRVGKDNLWVKETDDG